MDFRISDTNRGKKSLLCDGYIYRNDTVLKCGDISWQCTNKKCKGRVRTDSAMSTMNPINLDHNHEQDEKKIERQQLRAQVKRKATDDLTRYNYNTKIYHVSRLPVKVIKYHAIEMRK